MTKKRNMMLHSSEIILTSKKKRKYIWFDDASDEMKGTNTSTNISHTLACFKSEFLSTPSKSKLACSFEKASPSIQLYVFHPPVKTEFSSSKSRCEGKRVLWLFFGIFLGKFISLSNQKNGGKFPDTSEALLSDSGYSTLSTKVRPSFGTFRYLVRRFGRFVGVWG